MAAEIPSEISVHDLIARGDRRSKDSRLLTSQHPSWLDNKETQRRESLAEDRPVQVTHGLIIGNLPE